MVSQKNEYVEDFLGSLEQRYSQDSQDMSMVAWLNKNTTLNGRPFSTKGYEFQDAILNDMHPNMDVTKPSQVGMTEGQMRKSCGFLVRYRRTSLIFTLPTEDMYKRVSKTRFKPMVDKDEVFNLATSSGEKPARSMDLMQFGDSFLYLTPVIETAATSIPADAVMNDEVDLSNPQWLALFASRMQNSEWKINQRFSTPTFPGYGVDLGYSVSDQHEMMIKCDHCNHLNMPEFNDRFIHFEGGISSDLTDLTELTQDMVDKLDLDASYVRCEKCLRGLDIGNPDHMQWVPRYPDRKYARGYRINPFGVRTLDPKYMVTMLLRYKQREFLRGFWNTVQGLPYSDGSIRLDRDVILKCFTEQSSVPEVGPDAPVIIGIDVGQTCHIVAAVMHSDEIKVFMFRTVHVDNLLQTVKELCEDYNVVGGAIDRHPYEPTADDVMETSAGKIVPAEYRGTKEVNLVYNALKEMTHAQIDRTMAIDQVVRKIKKQQISFAGYGIYREVVIDHLRDMVRDETPDQPATWKKLNGNDHYFHALALMLVAMKIKDVEFEKDNTEQRSMVSLSSLDLSASNPTGLIGMSDGLNSKPNNIRTRVLN